MRFFIVTMIFVFSVIAPVLAAPLPTPVDVSQVPALSKFIKESQARIDYVGRQYGIDMWIATKNEVVQVLYTTDDGRAMLMNGFMFGPDGELITDKMMSDFVGGQPSVVEELAKNITDNQKPKTPSERLWADMASTNYIEFGSKSAPVVYTFMDPRCPHCKAFWVAITKQYVEQGDMQLRVVPVAILGSESNRLAGKILSANDPGQAWLEAENGTFSPDDSQQPTAPAKEALINHANIMQKWSVETTPFSIYKDTNGKVKMLRGNPDDITVLTRDLGIDVIAP